MKKTLLLAILCHLGILSLSAQTIDVTQTDSIRSDQSTLGLADPGDTIRYRVRISETGTTTPGDSIRLLITPDPNTTFVAGSFRSSPLALNDAYASTGNVGISVPAANGLLINDFDDNPGGLTILAEMNKASAQGGQSDINADGSFDYDPPANYTGMDTFTYILQDGNAVSGCPATDTGQVIISISNSIVFIDNSSTAAGSEGTLAEPYKSLPNFNAASGSGRVVYIEETGTDYSGGIVLSDGDRLIGKGHSGGSNLADVLPFTLPPFSNALADINGTNPVINNANGTAVSLASGNTLRGVDIGSNGTAQNGTGLSGSSVGNLTIDEMSIFVGGGSAGKGVDINGAGTIDIELVELDLVSCNPIAVDLNGIGGGTWEVSGITDIDNASTTGVEITNSGSATFTFDQLDIDNTASNGTGLSASNAGTLNTNSGTINSGSGRAVDVDNAALGMMLTSVSSNGGNTPAIDLNTTTGSFEIAGTGTTNGSGGTIENKTNTDAIIFNATSNSCTFRNLIIQDIRSSTDNSDNFGTRTGIDGIHGENVTGGLILDNVVMRRFSDNAINGATFGGAFPGLGATTWIGLEILNSTIEFSNRFHVSNVGDSSDEGLVRIVGLSGTVVVDNSTLQHGAELMDLISATSGTMTMTVTSSIFNRSIEEYATPCCGAAIANVGKAGIDLIVKGSLQLTAVLGDKNDASKKNTFTDNATASIRLVGETGGTNPSTGSVELTIANNDFIVLDHSSSTMGGGGLFNFPQGGVVIGGGGGNAFSINALVKDNLFQEVMHASGGLGQLTLVFDDGDAQVKVTGNTFDRPWDAPVRILADGNDDAFVLFENNTYIGGCVGGPGTDIQAGGLNCPQCPPNFCLSPFAPFQAFVRNNGNLDLTLDGEDLNPVDLVNGPSQNSFTAEVQASGGNLCLNLENNSSPNGYGLTQSAGTFDITKGLSNTGPCAGCSTAQLQDVLADNSNTGGGGVPTNPPVISHMGAINVSNTVCSLPSGVLFAKADPFLQLFERARPAKLCKNQMSVDTELLYSFSDQNYLQKP